MSENNVRPTKKQREILVFIDHFIREHGFSPSFREVMTGLNYTSVATVSLHINNLIRRGHLRKRDHSARSLEVVGSIEDGPDHSAWLTGEVRRLLTDPLTTEADKTALIRVTELLVSLDAASSLKA